jgi:hypothetical protein
MNDNVSRSVASGSNSNVTQLAAGCYLLNYVPNKTLQAVFDGQLRVEVREQETVISADLYQRDFDDAVDAFPTPPGRVEMWRGSRRFGLSVIRPFRLAVPK